MAKYLCVIVVFTSSIVLGAMTTFAQENPEEGFYANVRERLQKKDVTRPPQGEIVPEEEVDTSTKFTWQLFSLGSEMLPADEENGCVNIMAAARTLSVLQEGASGDTRTALTRVFENDSSFDEFFTQYKLPHEVCLAIAPYNFSEIFLEKAMKKGFSLKKEKLEPTFIEVLNESIEERTTIADAVPYEPNMETLFVDVAICDAKWQTEFENIGREAFFAADGSESFVDFIGGEVKDAKHLCSPMEGWRVEMSDGYTLFLFETTEQSSAAEICEIFSHKSVVKFDRTADIVLEMPKISIESEFDFASIEGLKQIFEDSADFRFMLENRDPKISVCKQLNRLVLDEQGLLSTSVTVVTAISKSITLPPKMKGEVICYNTPFIGILTKDVEVNGKLDNQPILVFTVNTVND